MDASEGEEAINLLKQQLEEKKESLATARKECSRLRDEKEEAAREHIADAQRIAALYKQETEVRRLADSYRAIHCIMCPF